jgi:hypothetical protein
MKVVLNLGFDREATGADCAPQDARIVVQTDAGAHEVLTLAAASAFARRLLLAIAQGQDALRAARGETGEAA